MIALAYAFKGLAMTPYKLPCTIFIDQDSPLNGFLIIYNCMVKRQILKFALIDNHFL